MNPLADIENKFIGRTLIYKTVINIKRSNNKYKFKDIKTEYIERNDKSK